MKLYIVDHKVILEDRPNGKIQWLFKLDQNSKVIDSIFERRTMEWLVQYFGPIKPDLQIEILKYC